MNISVRSHFFKVNKIVFSTSGLSEFECFLCDSVHTNKPNSTTEIFTWTYIVMPNSNNLILVSRYSVLSFSFSSYLFVSFVHILIVLLSYFDITVCNYVNISWKPIALWQATSEENTKGLQDKDFIHEYLK